MNVRGSTRGASISGTTDPGKYMASTAGTLWRSRRRMKVRHRRWASSLREASGTVISDCGSVASWLKPVGGQKSITGGAESTNGGAQAEPSDSTHESDHPINQDGHEGFRRNVVAISRAIYKVPRSRADEPPGNGSHKRKQQGPASQEEACGYADSEVRPAKEHVASVGGIGLLE